MAKSSKSEKSQLVGFLIGFAVIAAIIGGAIWYLESQKVEDEPQFEEQDLNLDFLDE